MSERILITGANGFLGTYIYKTLFHEHDVYTLYRSKTKSDKHIQADISKPLPDLPDVDTVIHVAGKAHTLPKTKEEKEAFYNVNYIGSQYLTNALAKKPIPPKKLIFISTVAVYGVETGEFITENHPLLASDPYGNSKVLAEHHLLDWGREHRVKVTILRLPLIAGLNAPGNLGAMAQAIKKGRYFGVGTGSARRSIVLAEDVAKFVLTAGEHGGIYNLSDGDHPTFNAIEKAIAKSLGKKRPAHLPTWLAKTVAAIGDLLEKMSGKPFPINSYKLSKMTNSLTFSDQRARKKLGWNPRKFTEETPDLF